MDSRKVTLVVAVVAIALLAVGIGYAYTTTVTTTNNTIDVQNIEVVPCVDTATAPLYTGSTVNIQFNTAKLGDENLKYGISILDPASTPIKKSDNSVIVSDYQYLTQVNKLVVKSEGGVGKTLDSLSVTIQGNSDLTTQLSTGNYKSCVIYAILKDSNGKACVLSTPATTDATNSAKHNLVFTTDFTAAEEGFIKVLNANNVADGSVTYDFYFVIAGEDAVEGCIHEGKLTETAFQIQYQATAKNTPANA